MFFTVEKLHKRVEELAPYRYRNRQPIEGWLSVDEEGGKSKYPPVDVDWQPVSVGAEWHALDHYYWLKADVTLPDVANLVLLFNFGLPGNLNQTGFEGLLFMDGKPYQGIDSNHQEVAIRPEDQGKTHCLTIKLWTGMYGRHGNRKEGLTHKFKYADLAILDQHTDNLYYAARNMIDTIDILSETDATRVEMLNRLDQAIRLLDWQEPGSDAFYASCREADLVLTDYLQQVVKQTPVTVTALGHTHIDLAWLWRLKHTREKAARSFATVLRMMEQYPEYVFMQSTPQLYQYIKEDYPEIYTQIKQRIQEGRWEVDGGMWLEADCNIPSGESLVRQLLFGTRFMQKEFNKRPHYLWLPDVFGYSWALPQILKKAGLDTFMTTKISWNEYNRMPHDTFMWKGIDGTEILTHFITTPDAGKMKDNPDSWFYTYNGEMTPASVKGLYDAYSDKNINSNLLLAYGFGDGGGGVNKDELESRRVLDQIPGLPHVKPDTAKSYFDGLHKTFEETDQYVPTWDGELYLEFHRGTYTSHAYMKKTNRSLELCYRQLEFLAALASVTTDAPVYPKAKFNEGWTVILRNQFHDIIPGSAIHEVYEDSRQDYAHAWQIAQDIEAELTDASIVPSAQTYTVVNSAGWQRRGLVTIDQPAAGHFQLEDGTAVASVRTGSAYQVLTPEIPATGSMALQFVADAQPEAVAAAAIVADDGVETPLYKVRWNASGQLVELFDKQAQRQVFDADSLNNTMAIFQDKPRDYDAWNIDLDYIQSKQLLKADTIEVVANDAFKVEVKFTYQYQDSTIDQIMTLYKDDPRIDFKTKVDWKARQKLLKVGFQPAVRATEARYQIQFGNLTRSTTWNTSWDWAKFESVGHQWADLSEHDYGVALLNNAKYGYAIKDNQMTLTLLKGAISPDPEADIGIHEFTYSLLPHTGDFVAGGVEQAAWDLNQPLTAQTGQFGGAKQLFTMPAAQTLAIDAIKQAEDSNEVIVRFHDHTGGTRHISLTPQFNSEGWREVNLLEEAADADWQSDDTAMVTLKPYEIKTLAFKPVRA